jgi:predicted nucleic acid-binding protein
VKIIVDANIIFSAILNTNGKIGDLLINSQKQFTFIAPEFLKQEIKEKYAKISAASHLSIDEIIVMENFLYKDITFLPISNIARTFWDYAYRLIENIDVDDVSYVAFAIALDCKIWTGDKKLIKGLRSNSFFNVINTDELFELRNSLSNNR